MFLCFQLAKQLEVGVTWASELAGLMIFKSDRTIHEWRMHFLRHDGEIPENRQGQYQHSGVLWTSISARNLRSLFYAVYMRKLKQGGEVNLAITNVCH